ncbi:hypothetical protein [Lacticaseibacillus jixiensis]|uniref:hypothetical protein n=1 Tax=Lacticaseibacillus jixiensis TaxID=3231926 RepID=UPI0036F2BBB6
MADGEWRSNPVYNRLWPEQALDFWGKLPDKVGIQIVWSGRHDRDYLKLADEYYHAAYRLATEVVQSGHDNVKDDMWFMATLFMFRQSLELLLKAKLYTIIKSKPTIQAMFQDLKHRISALLEEIHVRGGLDNIPENERRWLIAYIKNCEYWDGNSTLFRYPLTPEFLGSKPPRSVDVFWTADKLVIAYAILRCTFPNNEEYRDEVPTNFPNPIFFTTAASGTGNFYLEGLTSFSRGKNNYYPIIRGYLEVSEFLISTEPETQVPKTFFPELFTLRHLVELELKQLASSPYSEIEALGCNLNSHYVYSAYWKKIRPIIERQNDDSVPKTVGDNVDHFLKQLQAVDKQSDFFRYPSGYNHEYHKLPRKVDPNNIEICVRALTNMFEGCDGMFSEFAEYEAEERKYY